MELVGIDDKRQITAVSPGTCTMAGRFLPIFHMFSNSEVVSTSVENVQKQFVLVVVAR